MPIRVPYFYKRLTTGAQNFKKDCQLELNARKKGLPTRVLDFEEQLPTRAQDFRK